MEQARRSAETLAARGNFSSEFYKRVLTHLELFTNPESLEGGGN
jgi:hypothetical protein